MNFEAFLISKKIDSVAFSSAEPALWKTWCYEFENMHPNSFTAQKLYLINPIRRKYPLKSVPEKTAISSPLFTPDKSSDQIVPRENNSDVQTTSSPKPSIPKPLFKPKPKIS